MKRLLYAILVLALLAGCAAPAAAPAGDTGAASATGGVLRFGQNATDLGSLDPHLASASLDRGIADMIHNGLLRYTPGDSSVIEPDIAADFPAMEIVDGKQVWTFTLREGVICHPVGDVPAYELSSEDVLFSLTKAADSDRSAYSGEYAGMTFAAPDARTVVITLDQPLSTNLFYPKVANYAGGFIICKQGAEALGDQGLKTAAAGTGPFMFESYTPQDRVTLTANPDYFRGAPQLDGVEIRFTSDTTSRELGLRTGELDVINGDPDKAWADKMAAIEGIEVDIHGAGEVLSIHFNQNIAPLDQVEVRQAMAYALDRDEFAALFGEGVAKPVYSQVPPELLPGGLTQEEVAAAGIEYATDLEKARQMLADAGYPDGFDLSVVTSEQNSYRFAYESLQAQLAKVGINLDVQVVDHTSYHSIIREDSNALVVYLAWRPNADVFLTRFFHSNSEVVTGATPDTNFSHSDQVDALIEQARLETDPDAQVALWKEAQSSILSDMVAYPVLYTNQVYARQEYVDYGHEPKSVLANYPGFDETTSMAQP